VRHKPGDGSARGRQSHLVSRREPLRQTDAAEEHREGIIRRARDEQPAQEGRGEHRGRDGQLDAVPGQRFQGAQAVGRGRVEHQLVDVVGHRQAQVDRVIAFGRGFFGPVLRPPQSACHGAGRTFRDADGRDVPCLVLLVLRGLPAQHRGIRQRGLAAKVRDKAHLVGVGVGAHFGRGRRAVADACAVRVAERRSRCRPPDLHRVTGCVGDGRSGCPGGGIHRRHPQRGDRARRLHPEGADDLRHHTRGYGDAGQWPRLDEQRGVLSVRHENTVSHRCVVTDRRESRGDEPAAGEGEDARGVAAEVVQQVERASRLEQDVERGRGPVRRPDVERVDRPKGGEGRVAAGDVREVRLVADSR
jgi:hypothetical protein